ncbi:ATP synthase subunit alpha [Microbacterium mangrovi]|uniref:ATP synthase subunit alpha n=1 Tax=Microbacterium mangrovi TaxID=1348253 RepID=A0A0B2ACS5_9MICO|nr:DUF1254 domain-containing protein [Microbacterium mangrovi]KHK99441.1 ATP synthase subunit alpha [Microbacterium mangrovi]
MADADLTEMAAQAYVFGYPLVANLEQVVRYTQQRVGSVPRAAFNSFGHARALATPADTFVSINNDTVYSMAQVDTGPGPVRLHVPNTGGRYYVLQFVDAWTNNFAYVGTRSIGGGGGDFLLVAPDWDGRAGDEVIIRFPTRVASIVGRWAVSGEDDLRAVRALQDATTLESTAPHVAPAGVPHVVGDPADPIRFFERVRTWGEEFPPGHSDRHMMVHLEELGLSGAQPIIGMPDDVLEALRAGFGIGRERVETALRTGGGTALVNGWLPAIHATDYNTDFFEIGTIDDPSWKITDPDRRILQRALVALGGLWGNHGYEASYALTYLDADGEPLTGASDYELRLSPVPPVDAFWSVTMYDVPDYFLVENPLARYSLGDRTPGIEYDDDGGITVFLSAREPSDPKRRANWLPAPAGPFRPALRMYSPQAAVLDGSWMPPAIRRVT